jgi:hypothetical protein
LTRIDYNYLNLPERIHPETSGTDEIKFIYDATGTKWQKIYTTSSNTEKTSYCNNFIYKGEVSNMELDKVLHPKGLIEVEGTEYDYTYFLKDHLGIHVQ